MTKKSFSFNDVLKAEKESRKRNLFLSNKLSQRTSRNATNELSTEGANQIKTEATTLFNTRKNTENDENFSIKAFDEVTFQ